MIHLVRQQKGQRRRNSRVSYPGLITEEAGPELTVLCPERVFMLAGLHQSSSGSTSSVFPLPSWLSQFSSSSPPAPASVRGQLLIPSHTLLLGSLVVPSLQQRKSSSSPSTRASLFGSSL